MITPSKIMGAIATISIEAFIVFVSMSLMEMLYPQFTVYRVDWWIVFFFIYFAVSGLGMIFKKFIREHFGIREG